MKYRTFFNRFFLKFFYLVFIVCILPDSALLGDDYRLYPTGLLPPTEEETKSIEKEWSEIHTVRPNKIAIDRINKKRQEKNLPELNKIEIELMWKDNIEKIKRESDLNSQQVPYYLPYVDNSKLPAFPPIRSQGGLGSCAPFSVTYYQLTHMVSLQEGWDNKNEDNHTKFSPKWTYNFINYGTNGGASWYSSYRVIERHGAATWEEFPYDGNVYDPLNYRAWCLDPEVWENAIHYRTNPMEYLYIDSTNGFEQLKQLLINGYVLIFGTYIYSWQMTDVKDDPSTSEDDEFVGEGACFWMNNNDGYHSLTLVGYNDNLWIDINQNDMVDSGEHGALLIANSWGTDYENEGFTWLAYDALNLVSSVEGGPTEGRLKAIKYDRVMLLTVKESYLPSAVSKFKINHAKRNQIKIQLGMSEAHNSQPESVWDPGVIIYQGGEFAFDGTTTPISGTFVFDFTDLYLALDWTEYKAFYLIMEDNWFGDEATLEEFRVIDYENGGIDYNSHEVPQDVDADSLSVRVVEPTKKTIACLSDNWYAKAEDGGDNNGDNISRSPTKDSLAKWELIGDGIYHRIKLSGTEFYLSSEGPAGSISNGGNVHLWTWADSDLQRWELIPDGLFFRLRCAEYDMYMSGSGENINIHLWEWAGSDLQRWDIQDFTLPEVVRVISTQTVW
jgi:C1A family cysteine protease